MFPARRPARRVLPASPQHAPRTSRLGPWWRLPKRLALFATHLASKGGHLVRTSSPPYHLTTDCGSACPSFCTAGFHSSYRLVVSNVVICAGCLNYSDGTGSPFHFIINSATINGTWDLPFIEEGPSPDGVEGCRYYLLLPGWSADKYFGNVNCTPGSYLATYTRALISLVITPFGGVVDILGNSDPFGVGNYNDGRRIFSGSFSNSGCLDSSLTGIANFFTTCPSSEPPFGHLGTVDIIPL